jgi:hypothetical protein
MKGIVAFPFTPRTSTSHTMDTNCATACDQSNTTTASVATCPMQSADQAFTYSSDPQIESLFRAITNDDCNALQHWRDTHQHDAKFSDLSNIHCSKGYTPLHVAVLMMAEEVLADVIALQANKDALDSFGTSPLVYATTSQHYQAMKLVCASTYPSHQQARIGR